MQKVVLGALLVVMALVPGCQCLMQLEKGFVSQTTGINRTTTLFDYNGHMIGRWNSKTVIDADSGGLTTFFDSTANRVLINGGILVSVEHN